MSLGDRFHAWTGATATVDAVERGPLEVLIQGHLGDDAEFERPSRRPVGTPARPMLRQSDVGDGVHHRSGSTICMWAGHGRRADSTGARCR